MKDKIVIWKDGDNQNALEIDNNDCWLDTAIDMLGCGANDVCSCNPGEMGAYGVSMADDAWQATLGLKG